MPRLFLGALLVGSLVVFGSASHADEIEEFDVHASSPVNQQRSQDRSSSRGDSWYYQPSAEQSTYKPNPKQIVQQKAMVRSQQRSDRLASLAWYGMYNGRPTAAPIPYCTPLYSPAWQSPYGSGFSWRQGSPTIIVAGRPTYVVR